MRVCIYQYYDGEDAYRTFKEFSEAVLNDAELRKKFEEAKETFKKDGIKDKIELLSKAAAKLGFDVPVSEFKLNEICNKELSADELEVVTGGKCGLKCYNNFEDTDCSAIDFCDVLNYIYHIKSCESTFAEKYCLYTNDGWCWASDACNFQNIVYKCDESYTSDDCSADYVTDNVYI